MLNYKEWTIQDKLDFYVRLLEYIGTFLFFIVSAQMGDRIYKNYFL